MVFTLKKVLIITGKNNDSSHFKMKRFIYNIN
jgi:hypothetical protein